MSLNDLDSYVVCLNKRQGPGLATQQVMIPEENVPGPSWNVNDLLSQVIMHIR